MSFKVEELKSGVDLASLTGSTQASSDDSDPEEFFNNNEIEFIEAENSHILVKQPAKSYPFSHVFDNEVERDLYELSCSLPQGMIITLSASSMGTNESRIQKIHLDITQWNEQIQKKVQSLLEKMDNLEIITTTPSTVFPWALQFKNLRSLIIDNPYRESDALNQTHDRSQIQVDMSYLDKISTFDNLKEILFYKDLYCNNEGIKKYMIAVFKKLKDARRLGGLMIRENMEPIKEKVFQDFKKQQVQ